MQNTAHHFLSLRSDCLLLRSQRSNLSFKEITRYDFVRQVAGATVLDLQFVNR